MPRGGPQNTGKCLAHNTSGLAGIRFRRRDGRVYVDAAVRRERVSLSISSGGIEALREALRRRRRAGLPAPSLERAREALTRFLSEGGRA